jgi:hypothetical protein
MFVLIYIITAKAAKLTVGAEEGPVKKVGRSLPGMRRANLVRAVEQGVPRGTGLLRNVKRRDLTGLPPLSNNQTVNLTALSSKEGYLSTHNVSKLIEY